jgi:hypothetical protein
LRHQELKHKPEARKLYEGLPEFLGGLPTTFLEPEPEWRGNSSFKSWSISFGSRSPSSRGKT